MCLEGVCFFLDLGVLSFTSIMACHFWGDKVVNEGTFFLEEVTWPCALLFAVVGLVLFLAACFNF